MYMLTKSHVQKELLAQNSILQEENKILKSKLNVWKDSKYNLSEIESIKYKYEQLSNFVNGNLPGNEILQDMIKYNDELIKSNVEAKQKIKYLKLSIANLKQQCLAEDNKTLMSFNETKNCQSKLLKDFNESLELSKNISTGCYQCDALKVNYDHIYEMFMKYVDDHERTINILQSKELRIKDLVVEIEKLNAQPVVKEEKIKKYKQLIKEALKSVVKKDQEKIQIRKESKEMIDYYIVEMGKLNRKIESLQELGKVNLTEQNDTINNLSTIVADIFNHLLINAGQEFMSQNNKFDKKSIQFVDSDMDKIKGKWREIVNSINKLRQHVITNYQPKDQSNMDISTNKNIDDKLNKTMDDYLEEKPSKDTSMQNILDKFDEVKELTESIREASNRFNYSHTELHLAQRNECTDSDSDRYSPQYRLGHIGKHKTKHNHSIVDPFVSIYYEKDSLNNTAYQSFTADNYYSDIFSSSAFELMLQKIEELGEVIHRYSDIVQEIKLDNELSKADKSCLAIFNDDSKNKVEIWDSFMDESSSPEMYRDKKEKFEIEIQKKHQIILDLEAELLFCEQNLFENELVFNSRIDDLKSQLKESEASVQELSNMMIDSKNIYQHNIKDLQLKINNLEEQINQQNFVNDTKEKDSASRIDFLETELKQARSHLLSYQSDIDGLESANKQLSLEIIQLHQVCENMKAEFSVNVEGKDFLKTGLKQSRCQLVNGQTTIDGVQSNNEYLSQENENLKMKITQLNVDLKDSIEGLANMTKSLQIMANDSESLYNIIYTIYNKMISLQIIKPDCDSPKNSVDMINLIGKYLLEIISSVVKESNFEMKELVADTIVLSKNNYCEAEIENQKNLQISKASVEKSRKIKSNSSSFNDLTNFSSFNTDNEFVNVQTTNKAIVMTGFKIKTYQDVIDHPEKVVIMLRKYLKDIEDLKRRLAMRYEENKQLKQIIGSTYTSKICDSLTKKVEKLKEECSSNNENVEKVVKRNSKI